MGLRWRLRQVPDDQEEAGGTVRFHRLRQMRGLETAGSRTRAGGMMRSMSFNVLAGFHGLSFRVATEADKQAMARARWLRDAAVGTAVPTTGTLH